MKIDSMHAAVVLATAMYGATMAGNGAAIAADAPKKTQQQQIDALQQQLAAVQEQLKQLADQNQALLRSQVELQQEIAEDHKTLMAVQGHAADSATPAGLAPSGLGPATAGIPPVKAETPETGADARPISAFGGVKLWGYGEIYYTHPTHEVKRTQADLARAVFGIGYSFDDKTEFNSEFEVEHAVSSASDVGEFEVEQFYVDRKLTDSTTLRAGLFLMPFGLLNEHHEPTNYYGVQRNFVETLIIPSTWREGGFNVHADTPIGLSWNVGLTTGFDLSKWNFAPETPLYTTALELEDNDIAPLQATHQELALANAHNPAEYVALGYYGTPGLTLGAAITTGKANQVPGVAGDERITLWEGHVRWTPADLDLSALYAHGSISNVGLANAANPGSPNPIPSDFSGYFFQGAYSVWQYDDLRLAPFIRWERYDLGSRYSGTVGPTIPQGLVPLSDQPFDYGYWPQSRDRVWTVGANFYVTPHVVFKTDYQWFHVNEQFTRFDVGMGLAF